MGGESCNIADGIVRDNVSWYGLLLQFDNERVFVARKNPDKGQQTTSVSYIEVGDKIEVPESCNFSANTNSAGIEKALTQRIGISENLNMPPDGQSRLPLGTDFLFLSAPPIGTPLVWIGSAGYGAYIACLQGMMTLLCLAMDGAGRQLFGGKYRPADFFAIQKSKSAV